MSQPTLCITPKASLGACAGLVLVTFMTAPRAQGLPNYICKIERVARADESNVKTMDLQKKTYVGKEFTVDRRTGVMTGALRNAFITRPEVIDMGSHENSYKAITTLRREQGVGFGSNVYSLVVSEYVSGARKPFVFLENDDVYFGSCAHV